MYVLQRGTAVKQIKLQEKKFPVAACRRKIYSSCPAKIVGIGLLELMLSLLIIATIILLTTRYYSTTAENLRVTQAVEMINNISNAGYKWVQGKNNFAGITINTLTDAQFLPVDYSSSTANPWKGRIELMSSNDSSKLIIRMYNLNPSGCAALKQKMQRYAPDAACMTLLPDNTATFSGTF